MKIAILNDIHLGKALVRNEKVRAASHLAKEALPSLLNYITHHHKPDLLVNLGDLIRSSDQENDQALYQEGLSFFENLPYPTLHLIGNHEIKKLSTQDIEDIWKQKGIHQKSFGIQDMGKWNILWLGIDFRPEQPYKFALPQNQLSWLEMTVREIQKPTIIFCHCAIDQQNVAGNFFYEGYDVKHDRDFFFENAKEIQKKIQSQPFVELVVQAHLHYFHSKIYQGIPHVTCPAMADNICAPSVFEHVPEIYSILTLDEKQLLLKSYSREYCFAGCEFDRKNSC